MKELTFKQRCEELNKRMKDIPGKTNKLHIIKRAYKAGPIYRKRYGKVIHYCSECGAEVQWLGQHECPQCHCKWTGEPQEDIKAWDRNYHMELEAHGDIQVCRIYRAERRTFYGKKVVHAIWEVERIMYSPSGERVLFARNVQPMSWYCDAFSMSSPLTFKQEKNLYYKAEQRYNLSVRTYHIASLTKQWQYKNIPALLKEFDNSTVALRVIATAYGETLYKSGQTAMFRYLLQHPGETFPKETQQSINICNRNHYKIEDATMWLDNLELLKYFHLDTHSPKYLCPQNLRKNHQKMLYKRAMIENNIYVMRSIEEDEQLQKLIATWHKHMGKILTLSLKSDNLNIRPLQDVNEFKEEGEKMHHCVYANRYWNYKTHPNSLILSAKDDNGKRLATIEYNMANESIVQCRAACNAVPKRDAEIRALINDNKATFDKLLKAA